MNFFFFPSPSFCASFPPPYQIPKKKNTIRYSTVCFLCENAVPRFSFRYSKEYGMYIGKRVWWGTSKWVGFKNPISTMGEVNPSSRVVVDPCYHLVPPLAVVCCLSD